MDRRLLVLALGMFALGTDSFVVAGVLPQISHSFDVSIGAAGQMTTIYAITYALLAPTIAALAAGVPRKRLLLSGLGVFVAANLGTAVAPTFAVALLTRILAGLGAVMFAPTARPLEQERVLHPIIRQLTWASEPRHGPQINHRRCDARRIWSDPVRLQH
jgi:predicted MFS family arabinose efflux permease